MIAIGLPGTTEMLIILGIALLVFGGAKLPELARSVGRSVIEFKRGFRDIEDEVNEATELVKKETNEIKKETKK